MEYKTGAPVTTANGDNVGHLDRVVMDPRTKQVTHVVVRKGFFFTEDRVLPAAMVEGLRDDRLVLRPDITRGDLDNLPLFEEQHYIMAESGERVRADPTDRALPAAAPGAGVVGSPALYWYPPAVMAQPGVAHTTGMPSAAAAGVIGLDPAPPGYVTETARNIPENTVALKEGARVMAADDEVVGTVERVFTDADGRATHLLVSQGLLFKHHKPVPVGWIERVTDDHVTLAVGSGLLKGLPEYEG
jgi:uncharacterized protein YrrD